MKRQIPGLHPQTRNGEDAPDGIFLARVERAFYRWHPLRPLYVVRLVILEPKQYRDHSVSGRLYCTPRALWKLNWFLQDFGYDPDLLGRDEIDEKAVVGLRGIVRISHTVLNGHRFLNLEGFAPAGDWEDISVSVAGNQEAPRDL